MPICQLCRKPIDFLDCCEFHIIKDWAVREIETFCSISCLIDFLNKYFQQSLKSGVISQQKQELLLALQKAKLSQLQEKVPLISLSSMRISPIPEQNSIPESISPQAQLEKIVSELTLLHREELNSYYQSLLGNAINKLNAVLFDSYTDKSKPLPEIH